MTSPNSGRGSERSNQPTGRVHQPENQSMLSKLRAKLPFRSENKTRGSNQGREQVDLNEYFGRTPEGSSRAEQAQQEENRAFLAERQGLARRREYAERQKGHDSETNANRDLRAAHSQFMGRTTPAAEAG